MRNTRGFTLVELLVIAPIMMIVTVGIVTFLFNQYGSLVQQNAALNLRLEAQNILLGLQDDLWYANQFSSVMNPSLVDDYQAVGGWSSATTPPTLIINTAAITTNRRDVNRQPVYIDLSSCTPPDGNGVNDILHNNIIYFASGTNLYKRIVSAPPGTATCGTSYEKQTCPAANASPSCQADAVLSDHLSVFGITYYAADNTVATSPETAQSVQVDITLYDKAFAEDIYATTSLRLKKLNQL